MNVIHILNIADWALMAAGVGATVVMMIIGGRGDDQPDEKKPRRRIRRAR